MRIECMQEDVTCPVSPVEGHAASLLPKGKQWKLVWNDEFDGDTLDETKWSYRTYYWGQKSPTFTDHEGVELDGNSHMRMYLICENGQYRSPHLQTGSNSFDIPRDTDGFWPLGKMEKPKFMHRFGYYEIRCRLPKNDGWHAAFWLQTPSIGTAPDPRFCGVECDIMENYRQHTEGENRLRQRLGRIRKRLRLAGTFSGPLPGNGRRLALLWRGLVPGGLLLLYGRRPGGNAEPSGMSGFPCGTVYPCHYRMSRVPYAAAGSGKPSGTG